MNKKIQKKFRELFKKHICKGLIINSPRQTGKTTFLKNMAKELVENGESVTIITINLHHADMLKRELSGYNIQILSNSQTYKMGETKYIFYDEPWFYMDCIEEIPNTLFIGTNIKNHFTFDSSWVEKDLLHKLKQEISQECFEREFEQNIIRYEE